MVDLPKSNQTQTIFHPPKDIEELVLIHGKVTCATSRDVFEGPCMLPNERLLIHHTDGTTPRILAIQGMESDSGLGATRLHSVTEDEMAGEFLSGIITHSLCLKIELCLNSLRSRLMAYQAEV